MLRTAKWMRRYSTAAAAAVLLGGFGPPSQAASERIPSSRPSHIPFSFFGTENLPRRTGPSIERGWGARETGASSRGIEMPHRAIREGALSDHTMLRDETVSARLSKTRIQTESSSGVRMMGLWAFGRVGKFGNAPDEGNLSLFGLFVERSSHRGSPEVQRARSIAGRDRGDQFNSGVGWAGQSAGSDYSINANFSRHFDPTQRKYDDGSLLALGYSTEIGYRRDILYANGYWAEGDFRRLANSEPPPLGPIGLSFAGVGLRGYRPDPWPRLLDSAGFAIGMQTFFAEQAAHWTVELGHRQDLENADWLGGTSGTSLTTRAQLRLAERFLLQMDAFYAIHGRDSNVPRDVAYDDDSAALRVELRVNF